MTAPLAIKLHYPTFTSKNVNFGKTADHTSLRSCLKLRKLCPKDLKELGDEQVVAATSRHMCFWFEKSFRRENKAPGHFSTKGQLQCTNSSPCTARTRAMQRSCWSVAGQLPKSISDVASELYEYHSAQARTH